MVFEITTRRSDARKRIDMTPIHYRTKLRRAGLPVPPRNRGGRPRREGVRRKPSGGIYYPKPTGRPIGRPRKAL